MVTVRFAPSPTGIPHVGNVRTALFDYFFAKANNGSFILRLEDTDQARKLEGAEEVIKDGLTWLGVSWDKFVIQSERLSEYKKYADQLVEKGMAKIEDGAIRFSVPRAEEEDVSWVDAVGDKTVIFNTRDLEDFIILKADGYPTYHLANVIDDHLMDITHVIRGEDWIPSTPKHILLYRAFGWDIPKFAHVPNVMGTDGKKLSKRRGAKSVLDFRKEGYLPEALLNYLMLLGWSPKNDRELLSKEEIIHEFTLENINSAPSIFDERKLLWMNGEYIRNMTPQQLSQKIKEFDQDTDLNISQDDFIDFVSIAQTRIKTLVEFRLMVEPFVNGPATSPNEIKNELAKIFETIEEWSNQYILDAIKGYLAEKNRKFPDLYEALIGQRQGLPLSDVFSVLGKDRTLNLLK